MSRVSVWVKGDSSAAHLYDKGSILEAEWHNSASEHVNVTLSGSKVKQVLKQQVTLANPDSLSTRHTDDLTSLVYLDEANLLAALGDRYGQMAIYTLMANILIAVNPYRDLPLYDISRYDPNVRTPHVFSIAQSAMNQMSYVDPRTLTQRNQSIICCGESGSGKTVSTKQIMRYLCQSRVPSSASASSSSDLADQILDANPILEAFGNAQTLRNQNSSRFAKFIKMNFSPQGQVVGAFTETYLLERSRVVHPPTGERNFHIFYYLAASRFAKQQFHYLGTNSATLSEKECCAQFQDIQTRLKHFGLSSAELEQLWNLCSGVLHWGNIAPSPGTHDTDEFQVPPSATNSLQSVAKCWGIEPAILQRHLQSKTLRVKQDVVSMAQSARDAVVTRDATVKMLYSKLFQWLLQRINLITQAPGSQELPWIGILDVFGFESFQYNSFEQFCINLANEKLQQFFNQYVLTSEQLEYSKEGIVWQQRDLPDNSSTVQLLEGKPSGIISLVDSVCIMPKGTAEILVTNIMSLHNQHPKLQAAKHQKRTKHGSNKSLDPKVCFTILHYAGEVTYCTSEFLSKNNDSQHPDLITLWKTSTNPLIHQLLEAEEERNTAPQQGRLVSVGRLFQQQLGQLMTKLAETTPFFVRCINPNLKQRPNDFDWHHVLPQIKLGGLLQAVEMLKFGYPFRLPYLRLATPMFDQLHPKWIKYPLATSIKAPIFARNVCEGLLQYMKTQQHLEVGHYQLGITKIFFRTGQQQLLNQILQCGTQMNAECAQYVHAFLRRRRWDRLRQGTLTALHWRRRLRGMRLRYRWRKLVRFAVIFQKTWGKVLHRIKLRHDQVRWSVLSTGAERRRSASPQLSTPHLELEEEPEHTPTPLEITLTKMQHETEQLRQEAARLKEEQRIMLAASQSAALEREQKYTQHEEEWQLRESKLRGEVSQWQQELQQLAQRETELALQLQTKNEQVQEKANQLASVLVKQEALEQLIRDQEQAVKDKSQQLTTMKSQEQHLLSSVQEWRGKVDSLLQENKRDKERLESFKQETVETKEMLSSTQQMLAQHSAVVQNKDKTIERLRDYIKQLESKMQQEWHQYRGAVQSIYERRIKQLEKVVARQSAQIFRLTTAE